VFETECSAQTSFAKIGEFISILFNKRFFMLYVVIIRGNAGKKVLSNVQPVTTPHWDALEHLEHTLLPESAYVLVNLLLFLD
jgi:hypothetical protein